MPSQNDIILKICWSNKVLWTINFELWIVYVSPTATVWIDSFMAMTIWDGKPFNRDITIALNIDPTKDIFKLKNFFKSPFFLSLLLLLLFYFFCLFFSVHFCTLSCLFVYLFLCSSWQYFPFGSHSPRKLAVAEWRHQIKTTELVLTSWSSCIWQDSAAVGCVECANFGSWFHHTS